MNLVFNHITSTSYKGICIPVRSMWTYVTKSDCCFWFTIFNM